MKNTALQDRVPDNVCFGCGPHNPYGLHIKSYPQNGQFICHFQPKPYHSTLTPEFVNGGILASAIDCHSIWSAIAHEHDIENRELGSSPYIWYVTANLNVSYLKPVPINTDLTLRASIQSRNGKKTMVECYVDIGDTAYVKAETLAIRIKHDWGNE